MAIVSTTTRAPCCSRARLRIPAKRNLSEIDHRALCGIHPARLESGHRPVPKFHELRPPMAGRVGLGRQSRQDALGVGRMRTQRTPIRLAARWAAALFKTALPAVEDILVSARLGLLALGLGRLLRAGRPETSSPTACAELLADRLMALFSASRDARTGSGLKTCSPTTMRACRRR